jgi:hypothetical protein
VLVFIVYQATPPRSGGIGWCRSGNGIARTVSYVDSSATRSVGGSYDIAARGVRAKDSMRALGAR